MQADGMIGLGFPELSRQHDTFIKSMSDAKLIKSPTFSLYFGNNDYGRSKKNDSSNIIFGGHNLKKYSNEQFRYLRVLYTGYWSITLSKVQVGGDFAKTSTKMAIIDSGINLMTGPPADVLNVFSKIQENKKCVLSEFLVCECQEFDDFPEIEFVLDAVYFSVNPEEYLIKEGNSCVVLILSNKFGVWMLGNPFLRSYYSYFDMEKKLVGLARSSEASKLRGKSSSFWTITLITLAFVAFLILIILARILYLKRRRYARAPRIDQENMIPLQDLHK